MTREQLETDLEKVLRQFNRVQIVDMTILLLDHIGELKNQPKGKLHKEMPELIHKQFDKLPRESVVKFYQMSYVLWINTMRSARENEDSSKE